MNLVKIIFPCKKTTFLADLVAASIGIEKIGQCNRSTLPASAICALLMNLPGFWVEEGELAIVSLQWASVNQLVDAE
jgi:hypothetical protein